MNSIDCFSQAPERCCGDRRREAVRVSGTLCGIDYVEVYPDRLSLCVHFFGQLPPGLSARNVVIDGGDRIRDIQVTHAEFDQHDDGDTCLRVLVDKTGDFSTYCLCLVEAQDVTTRCTFDPLPAAPLVQPIPRGIDPRYACASFSFRVDCPSDLDCKPQPCPPAPRTPPPAIDYLSRDFASFRQLLLDRLSLTMPDWTERHIPDLGITIVELYAYLADRLSYELDAIATEAYLGTARRRISVRRHARLIDYRMHEGCNARAFVAIESDGNLPGVDCTDLVFATPPPDSATRTRGFVAWSDLVQIAGATLFQPIVFEVQTTIDIYAMHSTIHFYSWRGEECCLPAGTTRATLLDRDASAEAKVAVAEAQRILKLKKGDLLVLEEIRGAVTGNGADANPAHRHVVRLERVEPTVDPLDGTPLLEIEWMKADALPFALCLTARTAPIGATAIPVKPGQSVTFNVFGDDRASEDSSSLVSSSVPSHGTAVVRDDGTVTYTPAQGYVGSDEFAYAASDSDGATTQGVASFSVGMDEICGLVETAVARGNVILVDHGQTVFETNGDWIVSIDETVGCCDCDGTVADMQARAAHFDMTLKQSSVTHCVLPVDASAPAALACIQDPRDAAAQIDLDAAVSDPLGMTHSGWNGTYDWNAVQDLLSSGPADNQFVAEIDDEGTAHLRFGDGDCGRAPPAGWRYRARYRVGNGRAGNVGSDSIIWISRRSGPLSGIALRPRNPLPACGGIDPEPITDVKRYAPHAYGRVLERAVTAVDYATIAKNDARIEDANADLAWTGSWYDACVALDAFARDDGDRSIHRNTRARLERARRIGHDVRVVPALRVPLAIELAVCVADGYLRADVERALLDVLSNRVLSDGSLGLFHADRWIFGADVAASPIVSAVQSLDGVAHVEVIRFSRAGADDAKATQTLASEVIEIAPDEIAQLDNDPDFPERGTLTLDVKGGR